VSKRNGFKPSHFSFNVDGGRCDNCQGEGETVIEMQFMADIKLPCEVCNGKRFKKEVLESEYQSKNIYDVLEMTVDQAIEFFQNEKNIVDKLMPLQKVGLGYVKLGQGSNSLSGGEAQRVKLAFYLSKASPFKEGGAMFIFDEPTTGLHFYDIEKLINNQGMSKENLKAFLRVSQNRLENRKVCLNLEVIFSRIKWLLANFSIFFIMTPLLF
jgi:excinuclease ABC subunit A